MSVNFRDLSLASLHAAAPAVPVSITGREVQPESVVLLMHRQPVCGKSLNGCPLHRWAAILTTLSVLLWAQYSSAALYTIHNLGALPTGNQSQAFGLNFPQQVTGVARIMPPFSLEDHAVIYTIGGGLQDLGSISAGLHSSGAAINDLGVVAGSADTFTSTQAMTWDSLNGFAPLGTLPGHFFSEGHSINNNSTVVGSSNNGVDHAFRYPAGGPMVNLLPGSPTSIAYDVNDNENIVGVFDQSGVGTPFLWQNHLGTAAGLGILPGYTEGVARAINNSDQVIGTAAVGSSTEAFLWQNGTLTGLGLMPGLADSRARDINNQGEIVGRADNGGSGIGAVAALWDSSLQIVDLNTQIPLADQANWSLTEAFAINDRGDIAGVGFYNDGSSSGTRGFLLTLNSSAAAIPEPSCRLILLIIFLLTRLRQLILPAQGIRMPGNCPRLLDCR